MKIFALVLLSAVFFGRLAPSQTTGEVRIVPVHMQGDSSRLANFVEEFQREFSNHRLKLQLVQFDRDFQYNIVIAQESSVGDTAAAVIALDKKGLFVASVVRSGRMSGNGALNACAKELAKKLAVFSSSDSR
jgi:hypothetical protein